MPKYYSCSTTRLTRFRSFLRLAAYTLPFFYHWVRSIPGQPGTYCCLLIRDLGSQREIHFLKQIMYVFEHLLASFLPSPWVCAQWAFGFLVPTFYTTLAVSRFLHPRNPKPNLFPICTTSLIFHSSETQCRASSHSTLSGFVLQLWSLNVSV